MLASGDFAAAAANEQLQQVWLFFLLVAPLLHQHGGPPEQGYFETLVKLAAMLYGPWEEFRGRHDTVAIWHPRPEEEDSTLPWKLEPLQSQRVDVCAVVSMVANSY